jgi:hypothetical protein
MACKKPVTDPAELEAPAEMSESPATRAVASTGWIGLVLFLGWQEFFVETYASAGSRPGGSACPVTAMLGLVVLVFALECMMQEMTVRRWATSALVFAVFGSALPRGRDLRPRDGPALPLAPHPPGRFLPGGRRRLGDRRQRQPLEKYNRSMARPAVLVLLLLAGCSKANAPEKVKLISKGSSYSSSDYLVPGYVTILDFYADW